VSDQTALHLSSSNEPAAREALAKVGAEVAQTTLAQFEQQIAQEIATWQQFVAERGISAM